MSPLEIMGNLANGLGLITAAIQIALWGQQLKKSA